LPPYPSAPISWFFARKHHPQHPQSHIPASLRGKGSDHSYNKNSNNKPGTSRSDSFTALADDAIYAGGEADIRTFIIGEVDKRKEEEDSLPQRGIKVENKISRSFEQF